MTLFKDKYRVESARLPGYDYSSAGWYFITICTGNRIKYFGDIVVETSNLVVETSNLDVSTTKISPKYFILLPVQMVTKYHPADE